MLQRLRPKNQQQPPPEEVCVEFVRPFRHAEKDGKIGEFMEMLANR